MKNTKYILLSLALAIFTASLVYAFYFKDKVQPLDQAWETPIPNQKIPHNLVSLSAKDCGTCHKEHYSEWMQSTHAHAWTDPQFQAELSKESSPWFCINCHIPLQNQQEFIVTGKLNGDMYKPVKSKNPLFDRSLQQEGITCASCHVRDGKVIGAQGFGDAPHEVLKAPAMLDEKLCIGCHNTSAIVTPTLVCTFETGDEWKNGPYYGKKNCVSCHFPSVERSIVAGYPKRKSHYHFLPASGIPKYDSVKAHSLQSMEITAIKDKSSINVGQSINYNLNIKNAHAGHRMPSGDPERFVLIVFNLKNANNKIVYTKTDRIGEEWKWYPKAEKLSDNNLYPNEARDFKFNYLLKEKGKYKLEIKVTKHRMTPEMLKINKLDEKYPISINVWEEKVDFVVN